MVRAMSSNAVLAAYQILQQFRGVGAREFELVERALGEHKRLLTKPQ